MIGSPARGDASPSPIPQLTYVWPPSEYDTYSEYTARSGYGSGRYKGFLYSIGRDVYAIDHCIGFCEHKYRSYRVSPDGTVWDAGGSPIGVVTGWVFKP